MDTCLRLTVTAQSEADDSQNISDQQTTKSGSRHIFHERPQPMKQKRTTMESNETAARSVSGTEHSPNVGHDRPAMSRRSFLGRGATAGAALLATSWSSFPRNDDSHDNEEDHEDAPWFESSIPRLQELMESGELSSRELTHAYLHRIGRFNPLLNALIETNPEALAVATRLDRERRRGRVRGPLHGIPVVLKDNIATDDGMQTTAGSLALLGSRVPADAALTRRLRAAGAVILGKANLSEWANFRGNSPCPSSWTCLNGWSARGGFTQNPYILNWTTCGSSSGSGVAAAVNLCAAAVGTET